MASLAYLKQMDHPKKIAIIGDMLELGETSPALHQNLVPLIVDLALKKYF